MRMSDSEALMWTVEKDPSLRSDFCNLTLVDAPPDPDRLRAKVARALETIPRLGQRVEVPPLRLATPEWVDDPGLDLDHHVRVVRAPGRGTTRDLLDLCGRLAERPFDRSRPLWEFVMVTGLESGGAALLQKVHHTVFDGVGGLRLSLAVVDLEPDADLTVARPDAWSTRNTGDGGPEPAARPSGVGVLTHALGDAASRGAGAARSLVSATGRLAAHPTEVPARARDAARLAASIRRQVLVTDRAKSPLMTERSLERHFEVATVPMEPAKAVARRFGTTINEVFVTAVAGALGLYHERMATPADELRMAMPVNTRGRGEEGGNRFAPSRVVVPIVPADPEARLHAVHERLGGLRDEPAIGASEMLAALAGGLPTSVLVSFVRAQARTIDFATSNLRGSPVPLYLAGTRIVANHAFGPRAGAAVNVTLISYCGSLDLGLNLDPAAITEPELFMACLHESVAALFALAR